MYEFIYDNVPDADAYLKRIGFTGKVELNRETLNELVYCHQCTVPFENLDPALLQKANSLEPADLFDKVVSRRRGGYCFELNGIFMMLLRTLGFDAVSVGCRLVGGRDFLSPISHRGIEVFLDGKTYFCDVGYGGPMAPFAVELSGEKQTFYGETYWAEEAERGWKMICRGRGKGYNADGSDERERQPIVIFNPVPLLNGDFNAWNYQFSAIPGAGFTRMLMVNLRLPGGYRKISGNEYTEFLNDEKTVVQIPEEELKTVLKEKFGLVI